MEIPIISIEDDTYIYYPNGTIYHKRVKRFTGLSNDGKGYLQININKKKKQVHRVIYEKFNGEIPDGMQVDHINNVRDDNRIENLQLLTHQQNIQKQLIKSNNTSKYTGVSFVKRNNCWRVRIEKNDKYLLNKSGFETAELANQARNEFIDANPVLCKYFIKN